MKEKIEKIIRENKGYKKFIIVSKGEEILEVYKFEK